LDVEADQRKQLVLGCMSLIVPQVHRMRGGLHR
jgi:hypothetical protein